jgi:integrase
MATINWRGRSAYLDWREGGRRHRQTLGQITADEAETALQAKVFELRTGHRLIQESPFALIADSYLVWHARHYPHSHERIRGIVENWLIPHFDELTETAWNDYCDSRPVAPATLQKEFRTLCAIINWAIKRKLLTDNPLAAVEAPRLLDSRPVDFYTRAQLETLYQWSPIHHAVWRLCANSGLRRGEALQLGWQHIHDGFIWIESRQAARTKSGRWRKVPLTDGTKLALRILESRGTERVLPRQHPKSLTRAFEKCTRRAGLSGSLHWLRHTCAAHLVMAGVPIRTVQVLMGHASVKTTERYAHLAPDYLKGAVPISL